MKRLGHPLIYPWISKESYSLPKRPVAQQTEQQQVSLKFTSTERSFRIEAEMMQPEESLSIAVATAKFDNLLYLYIFKMVIESYYKPISLKINVNF